MFSAVRVASVAEVIFPASSGSMPLAARKKNRLYRSRLLRWPERKESMAHCGQVLRGQKTSFMSLLLPKFQSLASLLFKRCPCI